TSEQGKGYAAEAVSRACAWGFERFSLSAILGVTDEENVASQRVLRRCGFRRKEEKMMRLQGVERSAIIFELTEKNAQQTGCTERRDRAAVDNPNITGPALVSRDVRQKTMSRFESITIREVESSDLETF